MNYPANIAPKIARIEADLSTVTCTTDYITRVELEELYKKDVTLLLAMLRGLHAENKALQTENNTLKARQAQTPILLDIFSKPEIKHRG